MIRQLFNLFSACFNATVNVYTRLLLIVLSACVYHCFVFAEVFLNSYNLLYPPVLEKPLGKVQSSVSGIASYGIGIVAEKVNDK